MFSVAALDDDAFDIDDDAFNVDDDALVPGERSDVVLANTVLTRF